MTTDEKASVMDALDCNPYIGMTVINKDGICLFRTKKNEELSGIKNSDIMGKHYSVGVPHHNELLEVLETGVPRFGLPFRTINGDMTFIHRIPLKIDDEIIGALSVTIFRDAKEMKSILEKYNSTKNRLAYYERELRKLRTAKYTFENIIGMSNKITASKKLAENYAYGNSAVLITGETGTGKELFAHAIHLASPRKDGPFIRVNCGAIPADLLESELFGYEEGAFTGTRKATKIGKFELANHGTIFLDELSLLRLSMQPKLLSVLQNHEIERIGGNRIVRLDFRVISATNRNLEKMVEEGTFRSDLYYRLGILGLNLPSLRERKDDICLLARHFLESFNREYDFNIDGMDPQIPDILSDWNWPGNIRELRNVLERAVQVSDKKRVRVDDLPGYLTANWKFSALQCSAKQHPNILRKSKDEVEKKLLESALVSNSWNKSRTAKQLGVSRALLYALIKKHDSQGLLTRESSLQ